MTTTCKTQRPSLRLFAWLSMLTAVAILMAPEMAWAQQQNLGEIAKSVTGTFGAVAKLITAAAYIGGLGFAVGAILKFKQHKDNPTQIPIGTPIALLFVAAALVFLPTILGVTGTTLFGTGAQVGGVSGVIFGS